MLWNAQSVTSASKRLLLENTLANELIDILLIVETFLKPHHNFQLKGFTTYRNDRLPQPHGGVAIAIRNGLSHKMLQPIVTNFVENLAIEITINNTPTNVIVAYSPKHSQHFLNDIELLTSSSKQYLLFGDFNAKHSSWNCLANNKAGNELFTLQQSSSFLIHHTSEHTHFPHSGRTPSTIDILLSNVNFAFDYSTHPDQMMSDHTPTICRTTVFYQQSLNQRFNFSKANWIKYRQLVEVNTNGLRIPLNNEQTDSAIESFSNILLDAQSKSVPLHSFEHKPLISVFTKQLIQFKNMMYRQMQRATDANVKFNMKTTINKLQKKIKELIISDFNDSWDKKLSNIPKGGKKLWKLSKEFRGKCDSNANKIKIADNQSFGDTDRANLLANIFEKAHTTTASFTHNNDNTVRESLISFNAFSAWSCSAPVINAHEIYEIIHSLKPFKSPGPDAIQNILLKNLPMSAIMWLTAVFNNCLKSSYWPSSFKVAKVIPILKSGKSPSDAVNYRPISLLNAIGKIMEKVVYNRLIIAIDERNLLPPVQFGFRCGHSTIHQAMRIKQFITRNKSAKKSTGMILFDIEKAFDSVWHDGLIFKLIKMKLPTYLISTLR